MPVISNFSDLKKVSKALKEEAKAREAREKERLEKENRRQAEANQFAAAMAEFGVRRMPQKNLADTGAPKARPVARARMEDELTAHARLSDHGENNIFIASEDGRFFRRQGVSPDIPRKLHRGEWDVQASIDLHGYRLDDARDAIAGFLSESQRRGYRCVRIVHGKGYNSQGGKGILKDTVPRWLKQSREVMAFVEATPADGDSGAVRVLLAELKA